MTEPVIKEKNGKLTIFLGAMSGVGKTYNMLLAAREKKEQSEDVVIGWIDTHGRKETEKLAEPFERITTRNVEYNGKVYQEMDRESIIKRKPGLVIIDDMAYRNCPGSVNAKRFQDIKDILREGINIFTTLNIQNVESLNEIISQLTGIHASQTVPDRVIERSDFLKLIDITSDELIERFKDGRIYVPKQTEKAFIKSFRHENINALREMALRFVAKSENVEITDFIDKNRINWPWPIPGNIMVCVSASPYSSQTIRQAFQIARGLNTDWFAVYIDTRIKRFPMGKSEYIRLEKNMRLAEELGAKTITIVGEDITKEILEIARITNSNTLIIGKSMHNPVWDFIFGSITENLNQKAYGINIHIVQTEKEKVSFPFLKTDPTTGRFNIGHCLIGLIMVALVTVAGIIFRESLGLINIAFLYLLPIVLTASWWGRWPSYITALASVFIFGSLFEPPILIFDMANLKDMWCMFIFLVVAFIVGGKTEYLINEAHSARVREKSTRTLYEFSRRIAGIVEYNVIIRELCKQVAETLEKNVIILTPGENNILQITANYNPEKKKPGKVRKQDGEFPVLESYELLACEWSFKHARMAGSTTDIKPESGYLFIPLLLKESTEGVIGIYIGRKTISQEQRRLIETWIRLAAVAIERAKLKDAANEAALLEESKRLHTTLFNSLSHELRTPLSSIIGSVSTLIESDELYSPAEKSQLLEEIRNGARRLERIVTNLLDTARLESGKPELKIDSFSINDTIGTALRHMQDLLNRNKIEINTNDDLPFIIGDFVLIELVLINLLDNALKFSKDGGKITINTKESNGKIQISVSDEGNGIPEAEITKIFNKFYRVQNKEKTIYGSGLGLFICKAIVDMHGGKIWAENKSQGGTIINFTIPKAKTKGKVSDENV